MEQSFFRILLHRRPWLGPMRRITERLTSVGCCLASVVCDETVSVGQPLVRCVVQGFEERLHVGQIKDRLSVVGVFRAIARMQGASRLALLPMLIPVMWPEELKATLRISAVCAGTA